MRGFNAISVRIGNEIRESGEPDTHVASDELVNPSSSWSESAPKLERFGDHAQPPLVDKGRVWSDARQETLRVPRVVWVRKVYAYVREAG